MGGTGGDPSDDIAEMELPDAEHEIRVLNLLLRGEEGQAVPGILFGLLSGLERQLSWNPVASKARRL